MKSKPLNLSSSEQLWTRKLGTARSLSRIVKLDLLKKTDEAKQKFEKLEKSKECKVKKEKMTEEKMRKRSLNLIVVLLEACNQKSRS
jgi:hypothetical protein